MTIKRLGNHTQLLMLFIIFFLLISNPEIAFSSARNGLKLWADNVLPGIFPAMIISGCILSLYPMKNSVKYIYIAVCGLFCGYPLGSILCRQLHSQDRNEKLSNTIMAYCNVSSPSFVINYIMRMNCFNNISKPKILFCIYAPIIEALIILFFINRKKLLDTGAVSQQISEEHSCFTDVLDKSIWQAISNSLKLGGYIVLFSCLSGFIINMPFESSLFKTVLCSIIEITNGISLTDKLSGNTVLKIFLIICANAFGGISTIMQTMGMIKDSGLHIKKYIYHKLIFTAVTAINTAFMIYVS